jgi:asparagine synthase (glutamine-hydrolysing)
MSLTQDYELAKLINPDLNSRESESKFVKNFEFGNLSPFNRMTRSDFSGYLTGDLMVKADVASMANSLELRSPFLDVSIIEWGLSLPRKYKVKGFETKHILKDVARSLIPGKLIDRPKMGFSIPRAEWLRGGMKELTLNVLTDTTATQRGWFNAIEVNKVIKAHMSGEDKDNLIWPLLMLELWARTWLD